MVQTKQHKTKLEVAPEADAPTDYPQDSTVHPEVSFFEAAQSVLQNNDHGTFTIPADGLYPHQWLWDSCFIAIGQRHYDIERAKIEILSILQGQWSNGMVPHMILNPLRNDNEGKPLRDSKIWRSWLSPYAPENISTSGITQPPMLAEAIVQVGQKLNMPERRSWYKQTFGALLAYHQWLYHERDPHGEGLVIQIHPWETGLDNTPPWMNELHEHSLPSWIKFVEKLHVDSLLSMLRTDTKYVTIEQRESTIDALALYDIQRRFRRKAYNFNKILDHSLFAIEDLTFNAIFIRANELLITIADTIHEELPEDFIKRTELSKKAFQQLWDDYAGEFFSRDFVTHKLLKQSSVATFMALYSGCISKEQAERIIQLLENEHRYGPAFPIPSTPLDSPWFNELRYWQGPTWVNINWLIIDGLHRYNFHDHADALKESTLEMISHAGFFEYFDPVNGTGLGTDNFSWTAALAIDLMQQKTKK